MVREIRYAVRRLLQDRWSTVAAILVAALGSGLNTAVFAFAYGVLVRPLPYRNAARLVVTDASAPFSRVADWRQHLSSFEQVGAYARDGFTVRGLGDPRFVPVAIVDDRFFETLGTRALAGRIYGARDPFDVAVVSERLAREANSTPDGLLDRRITVGETVVTVIGIMPDAFAVPADTIDVWIPAAAAPAVVFDSSADRRRARVIGRLRPGVTLAQARAEVERAKAALDPRQNTGRDVNKDVTPLADELVGDVRPALLAFMSAAILVLLIACANVATILIGRTVGRRRELAVRSAIGSTRRGLFFTVVSESLLISIGGALLGAAVAIAAVRLVVAWAAGMLPRLTEVRVDWPVLGFALLVSAIAAMLAALPAWRSIDRSAASLRVGVGGSRAGYRVRAALAAAQIALAVVLLGAGALLVRTVVGLLGGDIGVEPRGAIVSQLMATASTSFSARGREAWLTTLLQRVRGLPGVTAAGAGSSLPPDNAQLLMTVRLVRNGSEQTHALSLTAVTPGFLEALGAHLRQGRYVDESDVARADLVTVLSESAARAFMPTGTAVGSQLPFPLPEMRGRGRATVVGVVSDVKYSGLEANAGPSIYVLWKELPAGRLYLAVRTRGDALAAAPSVRSILRDADPRLPIMPIRRLDEVVERAAANRRLRALLGGSVALLALAIALVGLAGGLGRMVAERSRELAIRAALGATPLQVARGVIVDGGVVTAVGIVAGTGGTLAVGKILASFVFGISPRDPGTLALVACVVAAGAALACALPARRATMANPVDMLRSE